MLLLISLMYMITYMDRSNISIAAPEIAREFGFSKTEMALFFSAFAWAYAAGQVPGGWLADFFGPKKVLLAIVPFWSLMTAATAWAWGATSLFVVRFAFGLGEAGAFPTASRAMQLWFPKSERGFVQGMTHCFSRLAIAITPLVAVVILNAWGWRWIFYSFALLGVAWSVVFLLFYRNRPEEEARVNAEELAHIRGTRVTGQICPAPALLRSEVPWRLIFTSPNMWFIAVAYGCFFYGAYFYVSWFPTYLLEFHHLSLNSVGYLATLPLVSAMVGDLAGGPSDRPRAAQDRQSQTGAPRGGRARPAAGGVAAASRRHHRQCDHGRAVPDRLEFLSRTGARTGLGGADGCRRHLERNGDGGHEHGGRRRRLDLSFGVRPIGRSRFLGRAVLRHRGRAGRRCADLDFFDRPGKIRRRSAA